MKRGLERDRRVALGVVVGKAQLRVGQKLVGDAIALVVDLLQRLIPTRSRPPSSLTVTSVLGTNRW